MTALVNALASLEERIAAVADRHSMPRDGRRCRSKSFHAIRFSDVRASFSQRMREWRLHEENWKRERFPAPVLTQYY